MCTGNSDGCSVAQTFRYSAEMHPVAILEILVSGHTQKQVLKGIQKVAYDAGMADEVLMRLLFKLDSVIGEDEVRHIGFGTRCRILMSNILVILITCWSSLSRFACGESSR
jgi:hypothetical protein